MEVRSSSVLNVEVSSTASSFVSERRFDRGYTVAQVMQKLEMITGTMVKDMLIEVYKDDKIQFKLDNPDAILGSYHLDDGMRLHVIDNNPQGAKSLIDVSKVEKYVMSDESYDQRNSTVRSFLKKNKFGKFHPQEVATKQQTEDERKIEDEDALQRIHVGSRCQVTAPGKMARRGEVMYVGYTEFKPHVWVGVRYDEPYGKNDGTVMNKSYFKCDQGYGSFVRPKQVECGDFPELKIDDDEEEM